MNHAKFIDRSLVAAAAFAMALMAVGCSKKEKPVEHIPVIDVAKVITDSVTVHKEFPGYLTADKEVQLVARVDGYLLEQPHVAGAMVQKGQVLYRIEPSSYQDAVNQARASLTNAEATYAYAKSNYAAMQKAYAADAVSQMELLQSKSNLEAAEASIKNAKAALASAQTTLSYCTVRAPFNGRVSSSGYSEGAYLAGAAQPVGLGTIYDDAVIKANFAIEANDVAMLQANQRDPGLAVDMTRIPITFDVPLTHKYTGNLEYQAPAVDKSTGTLVMRAYIQNPEGELRSGLFCKIELPSAVMPKAMLIKDAAISTDQLGKFVYVVSDSNRVVYTPIEVGQTVRDTLRVVTKGLKPGDRYVTRAMLKVRNGMPVKPRLEN